MIHVPTIAKDGILQSLSLLALYHLLSNTQCSFLLQSLLFITFFLLFTMSLGRVTDTLLYLNQLTGFSSLLPVKVMGFHHFNPHQKKHQKPHTRNLIFFFQSNLIFFSKKKSKTIHANGPEMLSSKIRAAEVRP